MLESMLDRTRLGLAVAACDGHATGGDGSFVVADGETVADVVAEFERASERSRRIAAEFALEDTKPHPLAMVAGAVRLLAERGLQGARAVRWPTKP